VADSLREVAGLVSANVGVVQVLETIQHALREDFERHSWSVFMRNILDVSPKAHRDEIKSHIQAILKAPDIVTARMLLAKTLETFGKAAPRAMETLESGFDDAVAVMAMPEKYRTRLRTTNGLERLNEEIRRRERVIRIFPNRESAMRLIGALLLEIDSRWADGRRYLDMTDYREKCSSRSKPGTNVHFL
jgi:transposase-like protein